ncbi:MAG: DUF72 domain-containing protein [Chloroflexota bacterium]|jgi:uncharacterized protein YecE (DUF72 family)|nr:DUF72 domain-containing protein [Chloroflexota bacterium]MDP6758055.1 DUF72 domain-containing protein [Chloroflexota bacterium]
MVSPATAGLRIGTAGWSYADWYGTFYPLAAKTRGFDELEFYCQHFDTVELNSSYYRIPLPYLIESWIRRTPEDFLFSVKAFSALTHHFEAAATRTFGEFATAVAPFRKAGKLGTVLMQFPPRFQRDESGIAYLRLLPDLLPELPVVVEFRHESWVNGAAGGETVDLLRDLGLGFCCVDEPQLKGNMPPFTAATGSVGYVRFHGRNADDWWPAINQRHAQQLRREIRRDSGSHRERRAREKELTAQLEAQKAQRYNYLYSQTELFPWKNRIASVDREAATTFIITNNHFVGQAVANAKMLQTIFDQPPRGEETEHLQQLVLAASEAEQGSSWSVAEDDSSDPTAADGGHFQPRLTNI